MQRDALKTVSGRKADEVASLSLEAAGLGTWAFDLDDPAASVRSPIHDRLFGYDEPQRRWDAATAERYVVPEDRTALRRALDDAMTTGRYACELRVRRHEQEAVRWLCLQGCVRFDAHAHPISLAGVVMDVTERKGAELTLKASEERMTFAGSAALIGIWDLDVSTGRAFANAEYRTIYGLGPGDPVSPEAFIARVHPDDRARVVDNMRAVDVHGGVFNADCRIVRVSDGGVRWISFAGQVFLDGDGRRVRVFGVTVDVTERKERDEALRASEERLELAQDAAKFGVWDRDHVANVGYFDRGYRRIIGAPEDSFVSLDDYLAQVLPEDRDRIPEAVRRASLTDGNISVEYRLRRVSDGAIRWVSGRGRGYFGPDGALVRSVGVITDITEQKERAEALRASRERLALAQEGAQLGVYDRDLVNNVGYFDAGFRRIAGAPEDAAFTLEDYRGLLLPEDRARVPEAIGRASRTDGRLDIEYRIRRINDGAIRWVASRGRVSASADGRLTRSVGVIVDVTEQKERDEALKATRERFALAQEAAQLGVYDRDYVNGVVYFDAGLKRIIGAPEDAVLTADDYLALLLPEDQARIPGEIAQCGRADGSVDVEYRIRRMSDGAIRWVAGRGRVTVGPDGALNRSVGVIWDVTEHKEREAALEAGRRQLADQATALAEAARAATLAERRLAGAIDAIDDGFVMWDADDRLIAANRAFCEGLPLLAPLLKPGASVASLFEAGQRMGYFSDPSPAYRAWAKATAERTFDAHTAAETPGPDGRWYRVSTRGAPDGVVVAMRTDITDLKAREATLEANREQLTKQAAALAVAVRAATLAEQRLSGAIEAVDDGFVLFDAEDRFVVANRAFRDSLKPIGMYLRPGVPRATILDAGRKEGYFANPSSPRKAGAEALTFETENPDGRWYRDTKSATPDGGMVIVRTDITELKAHAAALEQQAEMLKHAVAGSELARTRLSNAIEAMRDGFVAFDADDRLIAINRTFLDILGPHGDAVRPGTKPEALFDALAGVGLFDSSNAWHARWRRLRLERNIEAMPPWEQQGPDGRWWRAQMFPTAEGGVIGIRADITESKTREARLERQTAELKALAMEAERANKAKSAFLAAMSHEMRTPLNAVIGFAGLVARAESDAERDGYIETLTASARSLIAIINDVLDFARFEAGKVELSEAPFALAPLVKECESTLRVLVQGKPVRIEATLGEDVPAAVRGDRGRVGQIALNFVSNAAKFTQAGKIALRASKTGGAGERAVLRFEVEDTGSGIGEAAQRRLFQPFEQGEADGAARASGAGLGLAISQRLARAMGGDVFFESRPSEGSRFWFEAPFDVVDPARLPPGEAMRSGAGPTRALDILVADDSAASRQLLSIVLTKRGHRVEDVADGQAALQAAARKRFDVVFMDIEMPKLDGLGAARAIRALGEPFASTPIVALTARAQDDERRAALDAGMADVIVKPFLEEQLDRALALVVAAPG